MTPLCYVCCLLLVVLPGPAVSQDPPVVKTKYGCVQGIYGTTRGGRRIVEFLAIPYAKPPLNELRFKSPEPPVPWEGVRNASTEQSPCLQQLVLIEAVRDVVSGSEDCLYLSVFTPDVNPSTKLPVIVYIHGGAYMGMSSEKFRYGPELLLDKDVVLVTFSYRIGIIGFMTTEDDVIPGNFHMKDQLMALKWVKENIAQFGGDVDSITLFGESSGAASTHLHTVSPASKGLFHRAIIHSGSGLCPWGYAEPGVLKKRAAVVAELVGCPFSPSKDFLACLQKLPGETIVRTNKHFLVWDLDPVVVWKPVIEKPCVKDAFLTKSPWELTSTVPVIFGMNYAEGGIKTCSVTGGDVSSKFKQWNAEYDSLAPISLLYGERSPDSAAITKAVRSFYFGSDNTEIKPDMITQITQMYSDTWFVNGVLDTVERHQGPKYLFYYTYNKTFSLCSIFWNNEVDLGACHLDELTNLFPMEGNYAKDPNSADYKLSLKMIEMWTNFAKTSVPSGGGVDWTPVETDALEHLEISNSGLSMKTYPVKERRAFWKSLKTHGAHDTTWSQTLNYCKRTAGSGLSVEPADCTVEPGN
ncbi:esterase E4-like [Homalodisca vitripennis]|uniref:esterase E4-like n=1 Tax=Homalodisca vitripennis TaxID=197043 RepID=UPI001EEC6348|nr:esterase E4-like [Homalodisca vitripennis]